MGLQGQAEILQAEKVGADRGNISDFADRQTDRPQKNTSSFKNQPASPRAQRLMSRGCRVQTPSTDPGRPTT